MPPVCSCRVGRLVVSARRHASVERTRRPNENCCRMSAGPSSGGSEASHVGGRATAKSERAKSKMTTL
ncbi:unnamed protein product [Protopolystoma xenopodis]|uniref:Uncharacterized protein n=1 Tax=Protopolystoma xenopodis TaxID=117903 RepID=A0A448X4F4_9PLAT|nr:unnamed protein product [Protopolystoma xenopodis]